MLGTIIYFFILFILVQLWMSSADKYDSVKNNPEIHFKKNPYLKLKQTRSNQSFFGWVLLIYFLVGFALIGDDSAYRECSPVSMTGAVECR